MKAQKRHEVFVQLDRFEKAILDARKPDINAKRLKRIISEYSNAYRRLAELGLAGELAEERARCSQ